MLRRVFRGSLGRYSNEFELKPTADAKKINILQLSKRILNSIFENVCLNKSPDNVLQDFHHREHISFIFRCVFFSSTKLLSDVFYIF